MFGRKTLVWKESYCLEGKLVFERKTSVLKENLCLEGKLLFGRKTIVGNATIPFYSPLHQ